MSEDVRKARKRDPLRSLDGLRGDAVGYAEEAFDDNADYESRKQKTLERYAAVKEALAAAAERDTPAVMREAGRDGATVVYVCPKCGAKIFVSSEDPRLPMPSFCPSCGKRLRAPASKKKA